MTPQPAGQVFGPAVPGLDREASEPPALETLTSNPQFVKPPPQSQGQAQPLAMEPTLTLGSLAESQPRTRRISPFGEVARSRSSLGQASSVIMARSGSYDGGQLQWWLMCPESVSLRFTGPSRTENPAERVLQDLDVYKTPLLPTRLRGSPGVPDMFRPRKLPLPVLMAGEHAKKQRLGSADKDEPGAKPYAGRGGMKKLLARRKQEEQDERQKEQESAMDEEQDQASGATVVQTESEIRNIPALPRLTVPEFPPASAAGRPSTLRVGRSKTSRSHAPSAQRGKNRFSAVDEEEGDDSMLTSEDGLVEAPKPPSLFQPPSGFSFAEGVSTSDFVVCNAGYNASQTAPIKLNSNASKEPPIASLPFSFGKPTSDASKTTAGSLSVPPTADPVDGQRDHAPATQDHTPAVPTVAAGPAPPTAAIAPATPLLQPVPSIELIPATPQPAKESEAFTEKIPNFFANSSILAKPVPQITLPAGTSLFGGAATAAATPGPSAVEIATTQTTKQKETPKQSLFGSSAPLTDSKAALSGMPTNSSASAFGTLTGTTMASGIQTVPDTSSTSTAAPTSIFGSAPANPAEQLASAGAALTFGAQAKAAEMSSTGASLFGKPVESATNADAARATSTSPFSFGAPAKPAETTTKATSAFSFGTPSQAAEGAAPSALGPPANIAAPAKPASTASAFVFGQPKEQPKPADVATPASVVEAPKPSLFGGSSSTFGSFNSAASSTTEPSKPSFTFGPPSAAASVPAAGAPAIQAPKPLFGGNGSTFSFGATSQGNTTTTAPEAPAKSPFTFGASPATPPATSADKPASAFTFTGGSRSSAPPQGSVVFSAPTSGSQGADVSSKPFTFGAAALARPATPPRQELEVSMDESPVRGAGMDMNGPSGVKEPLKLNTTFSFGQPSGPSPFGQPSASSATTPFAFGAPSSAPSIFGGAKSENKQEAKPSSGFSFGQSSGSGFSFAQKPADAPAPSVSPAFGGSGGFGQQTVAAPTAAPFAFSRSTSGGGTGGFGQPPAAPASPGPSGFGAPPANAFSFGATPTSATAPSAPFPGFGSQPASPATSAGGLPAAGGTQNTAFQFGQNTTQAPTVAASSSFGGPQALPAGGQAVFNIGTAPSSNSAQNRVTKKLPTRRAKR